MAECYNAAGNPDPTQYVNASGVCVHAGGRRRRARTATRKSRQNVMRRNVRRNGSLRRNARTNGSLRRNTRRNRRNTRRERR